MHSCSAYIERQRLFREGKKKSKGEWWKVIKEGRGKEKKKQEEKRKRGKEEKKEESQRRGKERRSKERGFSLWVGGVVHDTGPVERLAGLHSASTTT